MLTAEQSLLAEAILAFLLQQGDKITLSHGLPTVGGDATPPY